LKRQNANWSVLQDKRGIIYVGNDLGVLEFDGVYWRAIDIPNHKARSLALAEDGTIYVGGKDEFGSLTPDSRGSLQYKSLLHHLENNKRNFGNVWSTHSTKKGIYFRTHQYLFRWNPHTGKSNVWSPSNKFNAAHTREGKYFIQDENHGLMQVVNDSLEPFPGSEAVKGVKIYMTAFNGCLSLQKWIRIWKQRSCLTVFGCHRHRANLPWQHFAAVSSSSIHRGN
jgi:hypothetical protein